ncbi:MAG: bifunctional molybdenum cofactor biosynthesis protein MoaC/MoaB [bacterium]
MRDITRKISTLRSAEALAVLRLSPSTIDRIKAREVPKGDPLEVAKVAAIQAAKNTSRIIPYCHPLPIEYVGVEYEIGEGTIQVDITVKSIGKTGVEMEALTAASVAALTLYDMLKMLDDDMSIEAIKLLGKRGGKSDFRRKHKHGKLRAAVLVLSDSIAAGAKSDRSGQIIVERLEEEGIEIADYRIIPDDTEAIVKLLQEYADEQQLNLVMTTGGTGFSPRDNTPEATDQVIEKEASGIAEALRSYGQDRTPYSMLSRGRAGIRGQTLIVNLPGSRSGVTDSLNGIFPGLLHAFKMLKGDGHGDSGYGPAPGGGKTAGANPAGDGNDDTPDSSPTKE